MRRSNVHRGGTIEGWLGEAVGPPAPVNAERITVTVEDPEGMSCGTALWIVRALLRLDASVWVEHAEAGHMQVTDRGRRTAGFWGLWHRYYEGSKLTVAATGPDAAEALETCSEMAALDASERKGFYRDRYAGLRPAGTARRRCKVCEHPEVELIDQTLEEGRSPRSIRSDYPGLTRADLTAHRDGCA